MCYESCLYEDHIGGCYLSIERRKKLCPFMNKGGIAEKENLKTVRKIFKKSEFEKMDKEKINFDVPF